MRNVRLAVIAGALTLAFAASASAAFFLIYPPGTWPLGRTYSAHAARWWKWAVAQPAPVSPLTDDTGVHCGQGQSGLVWYLAGTLDGESVTRNCTVPIGRTLLFPIVNAAYFAFPSDPPEQKTEAFLRAQIEGTQENASDLSLTIDGVAVPNVAAFYEESVVFGATLPADNVFGTDELVLSPAVDNGFYVAIAPMFPGKHTIHFHGELDGVVQDVTYKLDVRGF